MDITMPGAPEWPRSKTTALLKEASFTFHDHVTLVFIHTGLPSLIPGAFVGDHLDPAATRVKAHLACEPR